jgi:hypothetical protein
VDDWNVEPAGRESKYCWRTEATGVVQVASKVSLAGGAGTVVVVGEDVDVVDVDVGVDVEGVVGAGGAVVVVVTMVDVDAAGLVVGATVVTVTVETLRGVVVTVVVAVVMERGVVVVVVVDDGLDVVTTTAFACVDAAPAVAASVGTASPTTSRPSVATAVRTCRLPRRAVWRRLLLRSCVALLGACPCPWSIAPPSPPGSGSLHGPQGGMHFGDPADSGSPVALRPPLAEGLPFRLQVMRTEMH